MSNTQLKLAFGETEAISYKDYQSLTNYQIYASQIDLCQNEASKSSFEFLRACMVPLSDVEVGEYQIREELIHKDHVEDIYQSYVKAYNKEESRYLTDLPIYAYSEGSSYLEIAQGHHRVAAFKKFCKDYLGIDNEEEMYLPAIIVRPLKDEPDAEYKKCKAEFEQFLNRVQVDFKPQKGANDSDVRKYLQKQIHFNKPLYNRIQSGDEFESYKQDLYQILDAGGHEHRFKGHTKRKFVQEVIQEVFGNVQVKRYERINAPKTTDIDRAKNQFWGSSKITANYNEDWVNDTIHLCGDTNNTTKSLELARRSRARQAYRQPNKFLVTPGKVRLMTWFDSSQFTGQNKFVHLCARRKGYIEDRILDNQTINHGRFSSIEYVEVTFVPQFEGKTKEESELEGITFEICTVTNNAWFVDKNTGERTEYTTYFENLMKLSSDDVTPQSRDQEIYLKISEIVGFTPRKEVFESTSQAWYDEQEAIAIARHIDKSITTKEIKVPVSGKLDTPTIFSTYVPNWAKQKTTATHPSLENAETMLFAIRNTKK